MPARTHHDPASQRLSLIPAAVAALAMCAAGDMASAQARGVSADGAVVVGDGNAFVDAGFRWTQAGGMQNLGTLPGGTYTFAPAVSGNGLVVQDAQADRT